MVCPATGPVVEGTGPAVCPVAGADVVPVVCAALVPELVPPLACAARLTESSGADSNTAAANISG